MTWKADWKKQKYLQLYIVKAWKCYRKSCPAQGHTEWRFAGKTKDPLLWNGIHGEKNKLSHRIFWREIVKMNVWVMLLENVHKAVHCLKNRCVGNQVSTFPMWITVEQVKNWWREQSEHIAKEYGVVVNMLTAMCFPWQAAWSVSFFTSTVTLSGRRNDSWSMDILNPGTKANTSSTDCTTITSPTLSSGFAFPVFSKYPSIVKAETTGKSLQSQRRPARYRKQKSLNRLSMEMLDRLL